MRPIPRKAVAQSHFYQSVDVGPVVAKIKGTVKKIGINYVKAKVALYNRRNLQIIAITTPDDNGNYHFLGLNTDLKTFIVALDNKQEFNAVIQDNVVPK